MLAVVAEAVLAEFAREGVEPLEEGGRVVREDLRRDVIGHGTVGFVLEAGDAALVVRDDVREARGVLAEREVRRDERHARARVQVRPHDVHEVERVDVVGAEDEQHVRGVLAQEGQVAVQGVGVAGREAALVLVTAGVGRQDQQAAARAVQVPRATVGEVVVEGVQAVLLDDPDVADAAVRDAGQREVDEAVGAREAHDGLGAAFREDAEPLAPAAREDEREDTRSVSGRAGRGDVAAQRSVGLRGRHAASVTGARVRSPGRALRGTSRAARPPADAARPPGGPRGAR